MDQMQRITFKNIEHFDSWTTSLEPFEVENGKAAYHGLDLQYQLREKMPKAQKNRFGVPHMISERALSRWKNIGGG